MRQDLNHLIKSRVSKLIEQSEYSFACGKFLTPAEQAIFYRSAQSLGSHYLNKCFFFGGCRGADRRAAVFFPEWLDLDEAPANNSLYSPEREDFFIEASSGFDAMEVHGVSSVKITGSGYAELCHRDYLGAILGLGIERNMIGDIVTLNSAEAVAFAKTEICPYICASLEKIGRDTVKAALFEPDEDFKIIHSFEELSISVQSLRLDSIVGELCNLSRSEARERVEAALVDVNYTTEVKADKSLSEGDVVSVRGVGKFIIGSANGTTRRGKVRLSAKKFI